MALLSLCRGLLPAEGEFDGVAASAAQHRAAELLAVTAADRATLAAPLALIDEVRAVWFAVLLMQAWP